MSSLLEEGDSKAGFYYDLKFLIILIYVPFFVFAVLQSGFDLSTGFYITNTIFLSLLILLDLQEFIEVMVPRYGWKCSKLNYRLSTTFLVLGVLVVSITGHLNSRIITKLPLYLSFALLLLSVGLLGVPLLGIVFALICYSDFASSRGVSIWRRDQEITDAVSNHSFFYQHLFRRKKQNNSAL